MTQKSETGKLGEDVAVQYLANKGYLIIERNHRQKWGELDIVSIDPKGVLALIEVKAVGGPNPFIEAEEQMSSHKIQKFKRAAELYANNYFRNRDDNKGYRLDMIAITLIGNDCRIKHYENIS